MQEVKRGCETYTAQYNREPGSFTIAVERVFSYRPDWHQGDCAQPTVQQYLHALDSAVAGRPEVQRYVVRCVHCGIRFLTDYRNPHRKDLRCPFGCRRCHEREASNRRAAEYRQTPRGKRTRHELNAQYYANHRRRTASDDGRHQDLSLPTPSRDTSAAHEPTIELSPASLSPSESAELPLPQSAQSQSPVNDRADASAVQEAPATLELSPGGAVLTESDVACSAMVPYVQTLLLLIEGVRMTRGQVVRLLQERLRQRSIARRPKIAYALAFLHQHPP